MVKLLISILLLVSFNVHAGYIAELERENKHTGETETLTLRTFGRNSFLLVENSVGEAHGWLYFDGGDYLVRRNVVGDWRLIGIGGHGVKHTEDNPHDSDSARVPPRQNVQVNVQLNDLDRPVSVATYSGNEYVAQIYKNGELAEYGKIVLSQHRDVTSLRDDYFTLLEGMSRRTGAALIDKDRAPQEMRYMRAISVMAKGGLIAYDSADIHLRLSSIESGTGPIFLPAPPETLKPGELDQLAINRY